MNLALSPTGHLYMLLSENTSVASNRATSTIILQAFAASEAEGLLSLANARPEANWSVSLHYWQDVLSIYTRSLCQQSPELKQIDICAPRLEIINTLLQRLPPMVGAEYCSVDVFQHLWRRLNCYVNELLVQCGDLARVFHDKLPRWQQVGRVCLHLAENKQDPDYPFAFLATYASHLGKNAEIQYLPLSRALKEYAGEGNKAALVRLLKPIHIAAKQCAWLNTLISSHDIYHPLRWTAQQAHAFLSSIPDLENNGIVVRVPNWWQKRPKPQVKVSIGSTKQATLNMQSLLDFNIDVVLGDESLTQAELNTLLKGDSGLVSLRGQWIEVDQDKLQAALDHWQTAEAQVGEGVSFIDGMRLLAGAGQDLSLHDTPVSMADETPWSYVSAGAWLHNILKTLRDPTQAQGRTLPTLHNASLRPYQQVGVQWLHFLSELGLGACLADDMGLGKTLQIIALLLLRKTAKKVKACSLIVLPASLLSNWKQEIARFAPTLKAFYLHPSETPRQDLEHLASSPNRLQAYDVVLTTYGTLWRQPWLAEQQWDRLILDEAQAIKNPTAKQTRTIKSLKAQARIALTGTPVENRVGDLWSLFDFLAPGLLGSAKTFKTFISRLNKQEPVSYEPLRKLVQPYILRRLKTDKKIIQDLPDKTELNSYCGLSKKQTTLYAKAVNELKDALHNPELSPVKRRGLVLNYLLKFKQICNHPTQALGHGEYTPADSGKFQRLQNLCEEISERQEKVLVFTQFREMTQPLNLFLETIFKQPGLLLHGSTPVKERRSLVDAFQTEAGPPFFVLSLKAGGTGLNLTAANHVIHFDRWWNPAVENQATDRAFRIGQQRNVLVHKFICKGTVEDHIDQLIKAKTQLSTELLSHDGGPALTELTDQELMNLVSLDVNKARL